MKISAKTRYGLRAMLLLALNYGKGPLFLKSISRREGISEKYLGQIMIPLKGAGLINSARGAHGGYELSRPPAKITIREIAEALEGGLKITEKVNGFSSYSRAAFCASSFVWERLEGKIQEALEEVTLESLTLKYGEDKKSSVMYNI